MVFFLESVVLGNWIPRIPDIKDKLALSGLELGIALLALSGGTMVAFLLAGLVTKRFGKRRTLVVSMPLWAIFFVLPGVVSNAPQLLLALFLAGLMMGLTEVAMNTAADQIEKQYQHRIMSRCHGFWSLGSLVGAAIGAMLAHLGVVTAVHFSLVMPVVAIIGWYFCNRLPDEQFDNSSVSTEPSKQPESSGLAGLSMLRERDLLLLAIMPVGIMCVEGIFIDWSALFVRNVLQADALAIGLVYAFFSAVMTTTRMLGDGLIDRFGAVAIARVSAVAATLGITLFSLSVSVPMAFVAAALSGLGVAIVYPLAMTAAAERPGAAAENVAAVALISFSAFLLAPPVTGFLSDWLGLRWALLIFAPLAALSGLLAGELVKSTAR